MIVLATPVIIPPAPVCRRRCRFAFADTVYTVDRPVHCLYAYDILLPVGMEEWKNLGPSTEELVVHS